MDRIYQVGIVRGVEGKRVTVEIARTSSCSENCAACRLGCSGTGITVQLDNSVNARIGDRVRIQGAGKNVATMAAFTYLVPLLMTVAGMVYGSKFIRGLYPKLDANFAGLISGMAALVLFYFLLKLVGKKLVPVGKNEPRIVGIINE